MTRPLAAGGFFVALVPEEPFLGKYNFYGTRLTWENSVFRFYNPRSTGYRGRQSASPGVGVAESPTPDPPEKTRSKTRSEGQGRLSGNDRQSDGGRPHGLRFHLNRLRLMRGRNPALKRLSLPPMRL